MSEFGDWPPELLARVIKATAPEKVCRTCGEPSRRITSNGGGDMGRHANDALGSNQRSLYRNPADRVSQVRTLGFSDCAHNDWRPGVVLDLFGVGITAEVAETLGRDGIEIQAE